MRSKKLKLMVGALLVTMVGATFVGCGSNGSSDNNTASNKDATTISISGSTSIGPLMEKIQEKYEEENSGVTLEIQQNGSGAGIKDVISGISEIGMSSRELKDDEKTSVQGTIVAYDGIALLVNPENPVKNISLEDVKKIYTGEITNWKELGGDDSTIVVVSREEGSGTRDAFQEIVGYESEELLKDATISDGSGAVKTTVAGNKNAIGFASFEYIDNTVAALNIDDVEPTADNVKSGSYKISRPFILVTKEDSLTEDGQKLISFVLSDEGQQIVEENKLITIE
ncbi:MAG: phosphate ABC transporter substrate-binding protein [Clostridium celatum]|uniref:phosphate ABC transporter substrate-binding protein n=1 Tax=Clostridium sp. TaxID=1506 RepID=UPI0025BB2703|nr:phosphate ABC transporter substrate-binding protein [Clostridium sp.]MBS6185068.1 phosphate ABC transporter substrate-binding protein [Clostridium celatum]MBS4958196.1 phosphate ABC transporter substrate-binding protein [Clostridium sp.]MDU2123732.1 phosphate ABC transporter substrate-binding protein [Clostridium celatum]MDU2490835.1 phosphate ABC transporter substrate-binding protein [Clostridium celatum]MDU4980139.1 phosphate ABC transporter substrate-binding protein [Clostridium celatum]